MGVDQEGQPWIGQREDHSSDGNKKGEIQKKIEGRNTSNKLIFEIRILWSDQKMARIAQHAANSPVIFWAGRFLVDWVIRYKKGKNGKSWGRFLAGSPARITSGISHFGVLRCASPH